MSQQYQSAVYMSNSMRASNLLQGNLYQSHQEDLMSHKKVHGSSREPQRQPAENKWKYYFSGVEDMDSFS